MANCSAFANSSARQWKGELLATALKQVVSQGEHGAYANQVLTDTGFSLCLGEEAQPTLSPRPFPHSPLLLTARVFLVVIFLKEQAEASC